MPNIKSAKKRVIVAKTRYEMNKQVKSNLRTTIKKAELAIAENADAKEEAVRLAVKAIDQACAKGIISKNCASRKKSKLTLKLNKAA